MLKYFCDSMKFQINDYIINYKVIKKDNKNLYFRFDEDCNLIITAPKYYKDEDIKVLIQKNSKAILRMYENALEISNRNKDFYYLGKPYDVLFDNRVNEVMIDDNSITCKNEEELAKFYDDECVRIFESEADICSKCFNNLPEYTLKIKKMRTRWGVCNTKKKTITLNSELLKKDISLIDYVIVHEMAHFYEGNHSAAFWKIVEEVIPDYKIRRKKIRH